MTKRKKPAPIKRRKSALVEALIASGGQGPKRWDFPPEALIDIAEARAVNESKRAYISARRLAAALKKAYDLPVTAKTIANRLVEMNGGRW